MPRPELEVADIFRRHGAEYRQAHADTVSPGQRRVMHAIELCRTAALGGHRDQCDRCGHERFSYDSCRNRHCPKCQSLAKAKWLEARQAELLPVEYFHVVFTVPETIAAVALQNKRVVYGILFRAASETLRTIAADPKHLGAKIGFLAVLHSWGQNLLHHPHLHCVVPGGGLSPDACRWISCRPGFFLPVRVLSRLFRGKFLAYLKIAFDQEKLRFGGKLARLAEPEVFSNFLRCARKTDWVVYSKPPFGGPSQVLDYLGRYTHRVAISNHRLVQLQDGKVTFRWKDYRRGNQIRLMTLDAGEFIRRFLLHVLPSGFMRLRHYGLFSNRDRAKKLTKCRELIGQSNPVISEPQASMDWKSRYQALTGVSLDICPRCHVGRMVCIETLPSSVRRPARRRSKPAVDSS
jgi:hypothetical protein